MKTLEQKYIEALEKIIELQNKVRDLENTQSSSLPLWIPPETPDFSKFDIKHNPFLVSPVIGPGVNINDCTTTTVGIAPTGPTISSLQNITKEK